MTTLQRVQKYRADTQKYLNERKREILRYSKKKGTWPQAEKWRLYGFTVGQIAKVIEEGGHTPDYSKIPIEYRLDDEGKPFIYISRAREKKSATNFFFGKFFHEKKKKRKNESGVQNAKHFQIEEVLCCIVVFVDAWRTTDLSLLLLLFR